MSSIDSYRHEVVGEFAGIYVYHPLEDICGEFSCTTGQLMLGGGLGEHPAMVLTRPAAAVANYLSEEIKNIKIKPAKRTAWEAIFTPMLDFNPANILKFYDWDIKTCHKFYQCSTNDFLLNPFCEGERSLEQWLILGFGEFIFFSMPQLVPEIMQHLEDPYPMFKHIRFNNIMAFPPNMPVYANGGNAFFKSNK